MTTAIVEHRESKATEYLQALRSMTAEIERAIQATAHNALSDLEESIDRQQVLSARLARLADDLAAPLQAQSTIALPATDEDIMHQIETAGETLQQLNRRYGALLQHSSRSVTLMTSLFRSFHGQFQEAFGPRFKQQTWSCQM